MSIRVDQRTHSLPDSHWTSATSRKMTPIATAAMKVQSALVSGCFSSTVRSCCGACSAQPTTRAAPPATASAPTRCRRRWSARASRRSRAAASSLAHYFRESVWRRRSRCCLRSLAASRFHRTRPAPISNMIRAHAARASRMALMNRTAGYADLGREGGAQPMYAGSRRAGVAPQSQAIRTVGPSTPASSSPHRRWSR